jgi:hypothetical protein
MRDGYEASGLNDPYTNSDSGQCLVSRLTGDVNSMSDWSTAPLATHQAAA